MKHSLRSLMIVVTLACVVVARMAQNRHMADSHEAAVQGLADQLAAEKLVNYSQDDVPLSTYRIREQIEDFAMGDCPVRARNDRGKVKLICVCEGLVLECHSEEAMELVLSAIQHERLATAYRASIWKPWRLFIEPPQMHLIRD